MAPFGLFFSYVSVAPLHGSMGVAPFGLPMCEIPDTPLLPYCLATGKNRE